MLRHGNSPGPLKHDGLTNLSTIHLVPAQLILLGSASTEVGGKLNCYRSTAPYNERTISIYHYRVVHETFITVARRKSIHVAMVTSYVSLLSLHELTTFAKG